MTKILRVLLTLCVLCGTTKAQDYLGYVNSNYSGISGAIINPANIVDNRMRVDITLGGLGFNFGNTYLGLNRTIVNGIGKGDSIQQFQKAYLTQVINGKDKSFIFTNRITGPSFMFGIGKKDAIGFSVNRRNYISLDGISEPLARLLFADIGRNANYNVSNFLGVNVKNKNISLCHM